MWIPKGKINPKYGISEMDFGQRFKVINRKLYSKEYEETIGTLVAMNHNSAILFNTVDGREKVTIELNDAIFEEISENEYLKLLNTKTNNLQTN